MSKSLVSAKEAGAATPFRDLLTTAGETIASQTDRRRGAGGRAFDEAREAGYREGLQLGTAEGAREGERRAYEDAWQARQTALAGISESVDAAMDLWFIESERLLAQLATAIAARILHKEIAADPEAVLVIAREAIAEVTHASSARIRVNPMDAPLLKENLDAIVARAPSLKHVVVVDDAAIAGGCVIETDGGVVEGTIEGMIHQALEALRLR